MVRYISGVGKLNRSHFVSGFAVLGSVFLLACGSSTPDTDSATSSASGMGGSTTTGMMTTSSGMGGQDAMCGNEKVESGEGCDDGNTTADDGCDANCKVEDGWDCDGEPSSCTAKCGDGKVVGVEACDDGNTTADDGCDANCAIETGWSCMGEPSMCSATCGDGKVVGSEACDDSNTTPSDGCDANCAIENGWTCMGEPSSCATVCGDGIIAGMEACDDKNTTPNDGCDASCALESGWSCAGEPSSCATLCGDGIIAGMEVCDDKNTAPNDGCDANCALESGWSCMGQPSTCSAVCGDGLVIGMEACDDKNTMSGDGCSSMCALEVGYDCDMNQPTTCTRLYPAIDEVNVGVTDHVVVHNHHSKDVQLAGLHMMWNESSGVDSWAMPSQVLKAGADIIISETANNPAGAIKPTGVNIGASYLTGGWVSLCEGTCSATNGSNVKDIMQYEGTGTSPALPSGVTFSGGPLTGIDNSLIQTNTAYARVSNPGQSFASIDWAWGCSTLLTCLVGDSFETNTGGLSGWAVAPGHAHTSFQSGIEAHGERALQQATSSQNNSWDGGRQKVLPQGSQPTVIQFWVRPDSTSEADAYVTVNSGTTGPYYSNALLFFLARENGQLAHFNGSYVSLGNYVAGRYYRIDVTNINWTSKTFSILAHELVGTTLTPLGSTQSSIKFRDQGINEVRRINLFNYSANSSARWDQITVY